MLMILLLLNVIALGIGFIERYLFITLRESVAYCKSLPVSHLEKSENAELIKMVVYTYQLTKNILNNVIYFSITICMWNTLVFGLMWYGKIPSEAVGSWLKWGTAGLNAISIMFFFQTASNAFKVLKSLKIFKYAMENS